MFPTRLAAAVCVMLTSLPAVADTILFYDSNGGTALSRIASQTDATLVTTSDATTSLGAGATFQSEHGTQSHTVTSGLGTGNDLMFLFGSGVLGGTVDNSLATGVWFGTSFTAAKGLTLDGLAAKVFSNSNNASSYAARDVAAFVRIGNSGSFTRFGTTYDFSAHSTLRTLSFTDTFVVQQGDVVQIRFAFTDRTRTNQDAQAATRIGSIDISAVPHSAVTVDSTAPTTDLLAFSAAGGTDTALYDEDANANHARGQLFSLPDGTGAQFEITAITVKKSSSQTFADDTLTLRVFEGTDTQWDSGTGHSTGTDGSDYYVDTGVTPLYTEAFNLNGPVTDNHYVTFELAAPLIVDEDSDFGFFMTYGQSDGANPDRFRHRENDTGGGRIAITTTGHGVTDANSRKVVYYVQGTAIGDGGALQLASPFQDRMVLQRDKPVNIWGQALPSTAVSVSINGTNANGTSDAEGHWKIELPALAAGGPHSLVVTSGTESITVNDVLAGDVWFCFGQSNMVWSLNSTGAAWHTAYENAIAANDNIRCLKIDQDAALTEEESVGMSWLPNSSSGSWTAVGSVFAHQLNAATGIPVAIVWAAWGSSSIEGWMPLELAGPLPHFDEMLALYQSASEYRDGTTISPRISGTYSSNLDAITDLTANGWSTSDHDIFLRTRPNIIYNKMVHPMRCYGISGFVWYQGETNAGAPNYAQYGFSLPRFVTEYRERFDQGDLPFLGVQLPSYNGTYWPWFRESQDQLRTVNNGHVAVTIDTGLSGNIHPPDKEPIGIRLSLLARKYALGEAIVADGPRFDSMSVSGNEATITFTNASGLNSDVSAGLFQIAGPGTSPTFFDADTISVSGNQVTISSGSVAIPAEVRYAWIPVPNALTTLENGSGIPAAPFRTDSFALPGLGAQAPMSVDDSYEIPRDQTLGVPVDGVLGNDIDLNHDPLSAVLVSDVSDGTLSLLSDGSFTYIPHGGFAGTDSFTYHCSDGGLNSSDATVTITVTGQVSGYYSWRTGIAWGAGDDETETGDPDVDGVVNFLEFAFGLDPLTADPSGLPTLTLSGSDALYDFNNVQPGVTYEVLLSTDLVNWSDPPFDSLTSTDPTPVLIPGTEAVNGRLFVRLRVGE